MNSRYGIKLKTDNKDIVWCVDDALRIFKSYDKDVFERWLDIFRTMSEKELIEALSNPLTIKMIPASEASDRVVRKILESENIVTKEKFKYPHLYVNEDGEAVESRVELIALPFQVRRPQQIAAKENRAVQDSSMTNATGQSTGKSRSGTYSETELNSSLAVGQKATIKEFMGPRSNNAKANEYIRKQILETGEASMVGMPDADTNKKTLRYMDVYFKFAGLVTDLIDDPDIVS